MATTITVEEIKQRLEAITPGPWEAEHRHTGCTAYDDERSGLGLEVHGPEPAWGRGQFSRAADAQFIAHAPDDIRLLLERVAVLETEIARQRHVIGRLVAVVKGLYDAMYEFASVVPDDQPYHHDEETDDRNLECTMRDVARGAKTTIGSLGLTWADGEGG